LKSYLMPMFTGKDVVTEGISHGTELILMVIAVLGAIAAIGFAWFKFVKTAAVPAEDGEERSVVSNVLYRKYYVDEIYHTIIEKPVLCLSSLLHKVDVYVIDRMVNSIGNVTVWIGGKTRTLQTGSLGFYLVAMVLSIIAFLVFGLMI